MCALDCAVVKYCHESMGPQEQVLPGVFKALTTDRNLLKVFLRVNLGSLLVSVRAQRISITRCAMESAPQQRKHLVLSSELGERN